MRKTIYPIFSKCIDHPAAERNERGRLKLSLNLKNALHYGYITTINANLPSGSNPLFEVYGPMIDSGPELRFHEAGIGVNAEGRRLSSNLLGRSLALGLMNEHYQFTWFANIDQLRSAPLGGWSAVTLDAGNSPDFLAASDDEFAVLEAKGTQYRINLKSDAVADWRRQTKNIVLCKDNVPVAFKSWLVAIRFVTTQQRALPEMLIEDPPLKGRELNDNDGRSLLFWVTMIHTQRNLERLGLFRLVVRLREPDIGKARVFVWQCTHPALAHFRFVGRTTTKLIQDIYHPFYEELLHHPEALKKYLSRYHEVDTGFFEGLELSIVRSLSYGEPARQVIVPAEINDRYDFLNLLPDGSLIAPVSLMQLLEVIDI